MASDISTSQLAQAVLQAVQGFYPESDEVASGKLSPENLPAIHDELQNAINQTKSEIASLRRDRKSVLESWVNDARRLHSDIAEHKAAEKEIVNLEASAVEESAKVQDVLNQRNLLTSELAFNNDLSTVIRGLLLIQAIFDEVQEKALAGKPDEASIELGNGEKSLQNIQGVEGVLAAGLLREKARRLRESLVASVESYWSKLVHIEVKEGYVKIERDVTYNGVSVRSEAIVSALQGLGLLKGKMDRLHQLLERTLIAPLLKPNDEGDDSITYSVDDDGTTIRTRRIAKDVNPRRLYGNLKTLLEFLWERMGPSNAPYLSKLLLPSLITQLLAVYLPSCIPSKLENLSLFEETLGETAEFEVFLEGKGWINKDESDLRDWAKRSPKVWLGKRKQDALERVRSVLNKGLGMPRVVERIERIVEVDGQFEQPSEQTNGAEEDQAMDNWDAKWDSDEEKQDEPKPEAAKGHSRRPSKAQKRSNLLMADDEEDVSGWGLDDDDINIDEDQPKAEGEKAKSEVEKEKPETEQLMDVDWEWGDEDNEEGEKQEKIKEPSNTTNASAPPPQDGRSKKDITLRETYKITSIPPAIMEIIFASLEEADGLSRDQYKSSPIASAASGILQVPTLIVAAYRALSPVFYVVAPMYLYNDCVWLDDQLKNLQGTNALSEEVSSHLDLSGDWKAISVFGRRAYTREMESQRVIVQDLMDGAQGFSRCTDFPLFTECENAVKSVVDRIKDVYASWRGILSHSVLLQSVGSLLNTAVAKFINDIEDLADISEDESHQLASFCAEMSKLEELFKPINQPVGEEVVPLTAVYCEKWLKFQYLANILESTMVDISYLWREGALQDFEPDELIDLVKALFADGDKRSKLISEIRQGFH